MEFQHTPILLHTIIEYLQIKPAGIYADGTLGGGGHAYEVASRLREGGRLIGFDQDGDAIEAAAKRLSPFAEHVTILRENFVHMKKALTDLGVESVDGILLDLGVSSYQLDAGERGFSYRIDAPLDMRMDRRNTLDAKTIVNTWSEKEICRILREYGEERFAANIARRIVQTRADHEIATTGELNEIVHAAIPAKMRRTGGHPSKRTFQALRIACNGELDVLRAALPDFIDLLSPGGRLCILTFHSLEDRIVKEAFRTAENPCVCPPDFPVCVCGKKPLGKVLTKKPILPSPEEMEENPRATSAKLRVFEKSTEQE